VDETDEFGQFLNVVGDVGEHPWLLSNRAIKVYSTEF
jgi:hypothetical protein